MLNVRHIIRLPEQIVDLDVCERHPIHIEVHVWLGRGRRGAGRH